MNKLKNPQIWLLILTLIAGAAYMTLKPDQAGTPGLGFPLPRSDNSSDSNLAQNKTSLKISKWVSSNNIPVYYVNAPELPMIDISVTFRAGSAYEPNKPGVASLANSMLVEGTTKYDTEQISEELEAIGAELSSGADLDSASLGLRSLTDTPKLNTALSVFTDVLANANFPQKSFNRLKNQTIESLKLEQQYPENILNRTFYKKIYNKHPYAVPTEGTIESVQKISQQDLVDFYNKYYVNNNAQIALVGAVTPEQARDIAEQISTAIKRGESVNSLPSTDKLSEVSTSHIDFPSTQTHILLGSVGIKRSDPDYFPLIVGNHILGRMPLNSLLFKSIRIDRGLAYSVYSSFSPMQNAGPFFINMQTRNEKANEALNVTKSTLDAFINYGPSDDDLQLAKQNLAGSFPLTISSNSKKLTTISNIGFYNLPLDYLDNYIDNINKVSVDDIKTAFKKHVDLNKLTIVTVGNNSKDSNVNNS